MNSPGTTISQLIEGFRNTALIATAVRLGVIDGLNDEPQLPRELAAALALDERATFRLLRGLSLLDIVEEHLDPSATVSRFRLTAAGRVLRSDGDGRLANYALLCARQYLPAWMQMGVALKDGGNPFESAFGSPVWQYREEHPEDAAIFNEWLHGQSSTVVDEIVATLDLSSCRTVADIGGGKGIVLSRILKRFPSCRGVLAEQPSILNQAERFFEECGLRDRCDLCPTDFLVSVPAGCDAYLLKSVLHDWDDEPSIRILDAIRQAMSPDSRLFIIERIQPALAREDPDTIWIDLMMMNVTGGRERTLREYKDLVKRANLSMARFVRTDAPFQIMEVMRS